MRIKTTCILLLSSCVMLASCNSDDNTSTQTGTLSVSLTDGPVEASAVVIHFTGATVQPSDGERYNVAVTHTDADGNTVPGHSIDLLQFTGDKSVVLFEEELPAGNYSWIRLDVDFDPAKTYITTATGDHALNCTSCGNNGLMLNRSFDIAANGTVAFTLDFELGQSITEANGNFKLRPTVRIVDNAAAGKIAGGVDPTMVQVIDVDAEGCLVYIYEGLDIVPNDIYIPATGSAPTGHNNPLSTTPVDLSAIDPDTGLYPYAAAFLPAGDYTVSLSCETDDPLTLDDSMKFYDPRNASVEAGAVFSADFPEP